MKTAVDLTDDDKVEALKDFFEGQNDLLCHIEADSPGVFPNPEFEEEEGGSRGKGGKKNIW